METKNSNSIDERHEMETKNDVSHINPFNQAHLMRSEALYGGLSKQAEQTYQVGDFSDFNRLKTAQKLPEKPLTIT